MYSQIEQTKFFKKLEEANTSLSKTLCGFLISMEKPTEDILSYIKSIYPSFTDHSISHSLRILEKTYMILSKDFINELSTVEVFCFICATMFHDCGMAIPNCDDIEEQRKNHHLLVGQILKKFFDDNLNLLTFSNRIYNCVLFACESHNLDLDEFYNHEKFGIEETIDDCKVRFSLVAVLLRVGDLLDMAEDRVYSNTINALPYYFYKNNSLAHHERHLNIDSYHLGTNRIEP